MIAISVVMAVHNCAAKLAPTLDSILHQTEGDFELLIVDDGSTDATPNLLAEYAACDRRVRVITQTNQGLTRSLITGCNAAQGTYIARHDADDLSHPQRFAIQKRPLDDNPDLVFVSCGTEYVGPRGEPLYVEHGSGAAAKPIPILDLSREHGIVDGPTHHGSVMMRRDAYIAAGGYRQEFYFGQDWDLWYRLAAIGRFQVLPDVLYVARISPGSISTAWRDTQTRLSKLSNAAMRARAAGEDERAILEQARMIGPPPGRTGENADGLYFIGEALRRRGDPAARRYLCQAIAARPWMLRAWLRWSQSLIGIPAVRR